VVDLAEGILPVVEAVDIVFWPVALEFKREDLEAMGDGEITASFVNGAIRTSEQEEMVQLLRRKSQLLIAFGACAQLGGIPSLANLFSREEILRWVYEGSPSTDGGARPQVRWRAPEGELELPSFHGRVRTLHQVVPVDYALPGCPPPVALVSQALEALLSGKLPPRGAVLAPDVALCESCPRKEFKPDRLSVSRLVRPHQVELDENDLPASPRGGVPGPSDPLGVRPGLHRGQHALHRLLGPHQPGPGPRGQGAFRARFAAGRPGAPGGRAAPGGAAGSCRHVLPLQRGRLVAGGGPGGGTP
jgi:F420-non-reducing hydrogenase small subunit